MGKKIKTVLLILVIALPKLFCNAIPVYIFLFIKNIFTHFLCDISSEEVIEFFIVLSLLTLTGIGFVFELIIPDPPTPEIQYGEFPFEIVYEMDGKIYEISDTIVFEYIGVENVSLIRHERDWHHYFKFSDGRYRAFDKDGTEPSDLHLYIGDAEYYMTKTLPKEGYLPGEVYFEGAYAHPYSLKELEEEHGIKIISTKFSEPLEENKCKYRTIDKIRKVLIFPYEFGLGIISPILINNSEH